MFCVQVRLDGAAKRSRHLSKSVAYVPQHDTHLLPYLTVYETCMYSAELQLPWFTSTADKRAKALAVLEELNLLGRGQLTRGRRRRGWESPWDPAVFAGESIRRVIGCRGDMPRDVRVNRRRPQRPHWSVHFIFVSVIMAIRLT